MKTDTIIPFLNVFLSLHKPNT